MVQGSARIGRVWMGASVSVVVMSRQGMEEVIDVTEVAMSDSGNDRGKAKRKAKPTGAVQNPFEPIERARPLFHDVSPRLTGKVGGATIYSPTDVSMLQSYVVVVGIR